MTSIPLTFRPTIPPNVNVGVVLKRAPIAATPGATAAPVTSGCETDLFFVAKMDGTGDLTGYTPDVGLPMTAPDVDFDDGSLSNVGANPGLVACKLNGSGAFLYDTTVNGALFLVLKPGSQPTKPDYFLEAEFESNPNTVNMNVLLAARCGPLNNVGWTDGLSFVGVLFSALLPDYEPDITKGDGAGGSSTASPFSNETLVAGVQTIKVRVDVVGSKVVARVNRDILGIYDFADPLYVLPGEIYFGFQFNDDGIGGTLFQAPIKTLRAGYL